MAPGGKSTGGVPPILRHDAPDPNRPYIAWSPLIVVVSWCVGICVIAIAVTWSAFGALSVLCAAVTAVASDPSMLRAGSVRRLERSMMKRARKRRARKVHCQRHCDRVVGIGNGCVGINGLVGAVGLITSPLAFALGTPWTDWVLASAAVLVLWLLNGMTWGVLTIMYAQLKGDQATGPLWFYGVRSVAHWLDTNPTSTQEIKVWGLAGTIFFAMLAFVGPLLT